MKDREDQNNRCFASFSAPVSIVGLTLRHDPICTVSEHHSLPLLSSATGNSPFQKISLG